MKKCSLILLLLSFALTAFSQAPQSFQYQAVVRNAAGEIIPNQTVGMRISLHLGTPVGSIVYQETHTPTSNAFGLVNLQVGMGTVVSPANLGSINFGAGPFFLEVELDPTGGTNYTITGTSQLMSVPYALYAETTNGITGGFYRGDTLKLTRSDGTVLNIVPCGVKDLATGSEATFNCLANTSAGSTDQVEVALSYTGMDENAIVVNNGMGIIGGDNPATTPNGTILVTGLTEGDSWDITLSGGLNGSCLLESSGTVPSNYCVPCGITSLATTAEEVNFVCLTHIPGINNDQVNIEIAYTGIDPDAVVVNNGGGTIGGDDPAAVADGTILLTGLMAGDTWDISIIGGASGGCNLNSTGFIHPLTCNLCGITDLDSGSEVTYTCHSLTPALNNDYVSVHFNYSGLADPGTIVNTNGLTYGGDQITQVADGNFWLGGSTQLKEGDSWTVSITGGPSNDCNFVSTGTVPSDVCSTVQVLLDGGWTPNDILSAGISKTELYGKTYQGGLIFYVDDTANPVTGLVALPGDLTYPWAWGCTGSSPATGVLVGDGAGNTTTILPCSVAAQKADLVNYQGYNDWFLPSRNEFNAMAINLFQLGYGNFKNGNNGQAYWTSSNFDNDKAYIKVFNGSNQYTTTNPKANAVWVRPIRAF
ncbi:MAG: hypothetical protein H6563_05135 [Lewinellaceae bacterium]|nr:hypothetical protein [Lewinellaceae bacterium]